MVIHGKFKVKKTKNFFTETATGAGEGQALGNSASGDDDGIGQDGLGISEDFEGSGGKIDPGDSFSEDLSAEVEGLGTAAIYDFITVNTIRETGEVLNIGGGGELAAWSNVVGHPAFKEDGTELGSGGIDGSGVGCRTAANDAETGVEGFKIVHEPPIKFPSLFLLFSSLFFKENRRENIMIFSIIFSFIFFFHRIFHVTQTKENNFPHDFFSFP